MTACHNIINSWVFFLFQSNDFKQKLFWKGRNIRNIHFDDTKVQLLPFIKGKQKFLLLFENSITSFMIFERTYQIISRSCIISYISGMSSTWLSLGQNIYNTVFYMFWETFLSMNKHFLCKQVHVIIWKSWGIRKIERGELGLNKILKDFKTLLQISTGNSSHYSCPPLCILSVNTILARCVALWNIPIDNEDFHTYYIQ